MNGRQPSPVGRICCGVTISHRLFLMHDYHDMCVCVRFQKSKCSMAYGTGHRLQFTCRQSSAAASSARVKTLNRTRIPGKSSNRSGSGYVANVALLSQQHKKIKLPLTISFFSLKPAGDKHTLIAWCTLRGGSSSGGDHLN